jgi:hypothetical protein
VVSHISRKTSEIWGTPRFLEGKERNTRFLEGKITHDLSQEQSLA